VKKTNKSTKKYCPGLFGLILLFVAVGTRADTQVYFSPMTNLMLPLAEHLKAATKSIDISVYSFSSSRIRDILVEKARAGVEVRVLSRQSNRDNFLSFLEDLGAEGGAVRVNSIINHHKFALVDSEKLYSSSGNFSDSSRQQSYDENSFITDSPTRVRRFQQEFDYIFHFGETVFPLQQNQNDDFQATPDDYFSSRSAMFTSINFKPRTWGDGWRWNVLEERGEVQAALARAIDRAEKTIQVASGYFRNYHLYSALVRAKRRGVSVQLILDQKEYFSESSQQEEDEDLQECLDEGQAREECYQQGFHFGRLAKKEGIEVRLKNYGMRWVFFKAKQMHHKYMIIDGEDVYTGSYNWSYNAEFNTLENVTLLTGDEAAKKYQENFETMWNYGGEDAYEKLMNKMQSAESGSRIDVFFSPMSLTFKQVSEMRSLFCAKCSSFCSNFYRYRNSPPDTCKVD
jgi:phosphatidylserine/phosphatidylglycerophosphate/cardiolipin synthase-like enzyme